MSELLADGNRKSLDYLESEIERSEIRACGGGTINSAVNGPVSGAATINVSLVKLHRLFQNAWIEEALCTAWSISGQAAPNTVICILERNPEVASSNTCRADLLSISRSAKLNAGNSKLSCELRDTPFAKGLSNQHVNVWGMFERNTSIFYGRLPQASIPKQVQIQYIPSIRFRSLGFCY